MARYRHGLVELGDGCYAYLQPDGGWGLSNAGLVVDGGETLLVDTLFDLRLTAAMLAEMRAAVPEAGGIDTLVNTHANGDHTFGNQLVGGARIVASARTVEEMREVPPAALAAVQRQVERTGMGEFFRRHFASFELAGIEHTLPRETFAGELDLNVGGRVARLIEVGPAHTRGDTLIHLPAQRLLYSGDILFHGAHPIVWAGPVSHWIAACDRILALDVETIVPGHGALAGRDAVHEQRAYFVYLLEAARERFEAGMDHVRAAHEIARERYVDWGESERVVVNVHVIYRELRGESGGVDPPTAFAEMTAFEDERGDGGSAPRG
jgi:glyoxylase-like metal-dependent hydrolase (beta-lactamase superfamily II)